MADKLITDAGVVEQIRAALPVVNSSKNGLADGNMLKAFSLKTFSLGNGESAELGPVSGMVVLRCGYQNGKAALYFITNYPFEVEHIAGHSHLNFEFYSDGTESSWTSKVFIKNKQGTTVSFSVAYQNIPPGQ